MNNLKNNEEISFLYHSSLWHFYLTQSVISFFRSTGAGRVLRGGDCLLQWHSRLHGDRRGKYTPRGTSYPVSRGNNRSILQRVAKLRENSTIPPRMMKSREFSRRIILNRDIKSLIRQFAILASLLLFIYSRICFDDRTEIFARIISIFDPIWDFMYCPI